MLETKDLTVDFYTEEGIVKAVRGVDLSVKKGEIVGIVGESGCGKSTLALSLIRLIDPPGRISGSIKFNGIDISGMEEKKMPSVRGKQISMIFQDPFSSLNPVLSIGEQIMETLRVHEGLDRKEARRRAITLLKQVKIKDPEERLDQYPHQFSGGMKQRIMIAMAIASKPKLLIADEPTTALDVITGREIMDLLIELRKSLDMAIILITHNIALASEFSDRFYVMYAGRIMEQGGREVISASRNPYTYMLLKCLPDVHKKSEELKVIQGRPPSMLEEIPGCSFSPRCVFLRKICKKSRPELCRVSRAHLSRCLRIKEIKFNG
ncbi:ABC transporter ATP-binding protein [Candidatus Margulisiibacteriota bacterium]